MALAYSNARRCSSGFFMSTLPQATILMPASRKSLPPSFQASGVPSLIGMWKSFTSANLIFNCWIILMASGRLNLRSE